MSGARQEKHKTESERKLYPDLSLPAVFMIIFKSKQTQFPYYKE